MRWIDMSQLRLFGRAQGIGDCGGDALSVAEL
jgi:hypothetical protein